jgi:metal-responsive CopG/Arc/MetJ family transcriptional regulator
MEETQMAKKLTITMHENLLERLDKYCDDNFQNRSAMVSIAVKQYLDNIEALGNLGYIAERLKAMETKKDSEVEAIINENQNA